MRAIRGRLRGELSIAYRCDVMLCLHTSIMFRGRRRRDEGVHTCNSSIRGCKIALGIALGIALDTHSCKASRS